MRSKRRLLTQVPCTYLLGLLNAKMIENYLSIIAPTLNTQPGDIGKLPILLDSKRADDIDAVVTSSVRLSKDDWDSFELSWDFKRHPLL